MALCMAALAGAVLGFLVFNFNPATIFMGDTGSMFLGFVLATVSIKTSTKSGTAVAMLVPMIALGLPIMDTLLAMFRRRPRPADVRCRPGAHPPPDDVPAEPQPPGRRPDALWAEHPLRRDGSRTGLCEQRPERAPASAIGIVVIVLSGSSGTSIPRERGRDRHPSP